MKAISIASTDSFAPNVFHIGDQTNDSALLTFSVTISKRGREDERGCETKIRFFGISYSAVEKDCFNGTAVMTRVM